MCHGPARRYPTSPPVPGAHDKEHAAKGPRRGSVAYLSRQRDGLEQPGNIGALRSGR